MFRKNLDILKSYFVIYLQDRRPHTAMIFSIVAEWIQKKTLTFQDISCPIKTKRQLKTKGTDWTSPHHGHTLLAPREWRAPFPFDASSINCMECHHVVVQRVWWRTGGRGETEGDGSVMTTPASPRHTPPTPGGSQQTCLTSHFKISYMSHGSKDILFFYRIVLLTSSSSPNIHPGICYQL